MHRSHHMRETGVLVFDLGNLEGQHVARWHVDAVCAGAAEH
ncbi:Uncharacterised protein [Mycobacterium tuberculosis]|nr:Uncharacterised protein [Mycobacterium tuberculosis]